MFRVKGLGFRVYSSGLRVQVQVMFRGMALGLRVYISGFRVEV